MSEALGTITFRKKESEIFLGRDIMSHQREYSEKTAETIDSEVKRIVLECTVRAKEILQTNVEKLKILADKLVEKEILNMDEINEALGFPAEKNFPDKENGKSVVKDAGKEPLAGTDGNPVPQAT